MMLADKGYYDYDFSMQAIDNKRRKERMRSKQALEIWSNERVDALLKTALDPKSGGLVFGQTMTAEQMQQLAMREMGITHDNDNSQHDIR